MLSSSPTFLTSAASITSTEPTPPATPGDDEERPLPKQSSSILSLDGGADEQLLGPQPEYEAKDQAEDPVSQVLGLFEARRKHQRGNWDNTDWYTVGVPPQHYKRLLQELEKDQNRDLRVFARSKLRYGPVDDRRGLLPIC